MKTDNNWGLRKTHSKNDTSKAWFVGYNRLPHPRREYYRDLIYQHKPKSILEIGCAAGCNIQLFDLDKTRVIGIDANKWAIEYAKEFFPKATFIEHDIIKPFPLTEKFDIVCSMGVLIHIFPDKINSVLKQMLDVSHRIILIEGYTNKEKHKKNRGGFWDTKYNFVKRFHNIDSTLNVLCQPLPKTLRKVKRHNLHAITVTK